MDDPRTLAEDAFQAYVDRARSGRAPDVEAFLAEQPPALRREIRRMVEDYRSLREQMGSAAPALEAGRTLGDFELVRELGRGGMSVVWEAEQRSLSRRVALKLLAPHYALSPNALERFEREARAGGRLAHPGIVQVYAVGHAEGTHFIAQELVPGGYTLADSLADFREARELPDDYYRGVAGLFQQIADALQHAHDQGVLHRDVKPSNILLSEGDHPRVADFGLARIQDELGLSRTGEIEGTPYYMSPEQAAARSMGIDHRTDVFSLGSTLYEALTLSRPFDGDTSQHVFRRILTVDPPDPRTLRSRVPRDLAVICLKALEKDPHRRFQSMRELADDLGRFLRDEPIASKPPGPLTRGAKWTRRHPTLSTAAAIAVVAVSLLVVLFLEARRQRDEALRQRAETLVARASEQVARRASSEARDEAEQQSYVAVVAQVATAIREGDHAWAAARLDDAPPGPRGWEWEHLRLRAGSGRPVAEGLRPLSGTVFSPRGSYVAPVGTDAGSLYDCDSATKLLQLTSDETEGATRPASIAFDPGEQWVAAGFRAGRVRVWSLQDRTLLHDLEAPNGTIRTLEFCPRGHWLLAHSRARQPRLWDVRDGFSPVDLEGHRRAVTFATFSPDGARVLTASDDETLRVWDVGRTDAALVLEGHDDDVVWAAFTADGERIVSLDEEGRLGIWGARSGQLQRMVTAHDATGSARATVSEDGRRVACFCEHGGHDNLRLFDAETGETVRSWRAHSKGVRAAAFGAGSSRLLSLGSGIDRALIGRPYRGGDPVLRLWDSATGELVTAMEGHEDDATCFAFSPDGERIVSGSRDRTLRVWTAASGRELATLRGHRKRVDSVTFSPAGGRLASTDIEGGVVATGALWLWEAEPVLPAARLHLPEGSRVPGVSRVFDVAFEPDSNHVVVSGQLQGTVARWSTSGNREEGYSLEEDRDIALPIALDSSGNRLAAGSYTGHLAVWDTHTRERIQSWLGYESITPAPTSVVAVALSPDGRRVASASREAGSLRTWEAATGSLEATGDLEALFGFSPAIAFSPDGTLLATATVEGRIHCWAADDLRLVKTLEGHSGAVWSLAFDRAGERLVSGSLDTTVRVWDVATGRESRVLTGHRDRVYDVALSPDDSRVASVSDDGSLRLWSTDTGEQLFAENADDEGLCSVTFSPDGAAIAAATFGGDVIQWHTRKSRATGLFEAATSSGDGEAVVRPLEAAAPIDEPGAHLSIARSHLEIDHFEAALASVARARQLDPALSAARSLEASILWQRGGPEAAREAVRVCRAWVAESPRSAEAHSTLANMLYDLGCYAEALDAARHAVEIAPDSERAQTALGSVLLISGEIEESIDVFSRLVESRPASATHRRSLGDAYSVGVDQLPAIEAYRESLARNPNSAVAHAYLGTALLAVGDADGAARELERALDTDLSRGWALRLSRAVAGQGDLDLALEVARRALHGEPSWLAAPPVASWIRSLEAAIDLGPEPDRISPEGAQGLLALAHRYYLGLDYERSVATYERAFELVASSAGGVRLEDEYFWAGCAAGARAVEGVGHERNAAAKLGLTWLEEDLARRSSAVAAGDTDVEGHRWFAVRSLTNADLRYFRNPHASAPWAERAEAHFDRVREALCSWSGLY